MARLTQQYAFGGVVYAVFGLVVHVPFIPSMKRWCSVLTSAVQRLKHVGGAYFEVFSAVSACMVAQS